MHRPNPRDFENDGEIPEGRARPYARFTEYTNQCRCGQCFCRKTWVEEGPDEHARASDIGTIMYRFLAESPPPRGLGSE